MDRGAWPSMIHGGHKELDTIEMTEHMFLDNLHLV